MIRSARRRRLGVTLALLTAALALPHLVAGAAALPPGCDVARPATGYHGDESPATTTAPVTCATHTGYAGAETHIRVADDGTVFEEPAVTTPGLAGTGYVPGAPGPRPETQLSPAGLAVTQNQAASWNFVEPAQSTWVASDASIYVDRPTGRLYYYALSDNPAPQGSQVPLEYQPPGPTAHLMTSADDGRTWHWTSLPGFLFSENPRFTSAPAPLGGDQPAAAERVAYWCGNNMLFTMAARICFRTLNGGTSWEQRSILFTKGVPQHPQCGSSGEDFDAGDGNYPEGAPDGTLWVLVSCGGNTFLAHSTDEGATWPIVATMPPTKELRVDPAGNLYAVQLNGTALELRTSSDGGQSWTAPVNMTAPAARNSGIGQWAVAVRDPGQLALTYLVDRPTGGFDGYVTVTADALSGDPAFFASTINDPSTPMASDAQEAKDDFIDVDLGPDGSAWAAFYSDCGTDASCSGAAGAPNPEGKSTTVGRLFWQ